MIITGIFVLNNLDWAGPLQDFRKIGSGVGVDVSGGALKLGLGYQYY